MPTPAPEPSDLSPVPAARDVSCAWVATYVEAVAASAVRACIVQAQRRSAAFRPSALFANWVSRRREARQTDHCRATATASIPVSTRADAGPAARSESLRHSLRADALDVDEFEPLGDVVAPNVRQWLRNAAAERVPAGEPGRAPSVRTVAALVHEDGAEADAAARPPLLGDDEPR